MALLPLASLGEIHGYRRVYLAGVTLFTVASIGCVMAGSFGWLTAARIVQGFGAAGLMSVNAALLRYTVPHDKLGAALGMNALVVAEAATAGTTPGGLLTPAPASPGLFALNHPLGAAGVH